MGNGYINKGVPGLGTELFGCSMMARCGRLVEPGKARSPGVGEGYVGLECARSSCVCSINLDVFDVQLERKIDIEGNCVSKEQIVDVMKRQCGFRFDSSVTSAEE